MLRMDPRHIDQKRKIKEEREKQKTRSWERNDGNKIGIHGRHDNWRKVLQKTKTKTKNNYY